MCDFTSLFRRYHHYSVWFRSSAGMRWFFHLALSLFPSPSEHESETCNHVNTRQQCLSKCGLNFEKLWCYTTCVTQKLTNCITVECWLNVLASTNETHCTSNCLIFCQPFCYLFFLETKVYLLHHLLSPFHLREQSFFLSFFLCHCQPLHDPIHLSLPSFLSSQALCRCCRQYFLPSSLSPLVLLSPYVPFFLFLLVCLNIFLFPCLTSTSSVCLSGYTHTHTHFFPT